MDDWDGGGYFLFKLARFLTAYRKQVILGPLFKLLEAILELMIPTLMALIIDVGINQGNRPYIYKVGGLMLLMVVLGVVSAFICQYYASIASQGFGTAVRNQLFEHIGRFSHSDIDRFGTSSLINRITNDVNQLQFAVAMLIRLVIRAPFLCIGGLIMAMILNLKLSVIIMAVLPLFIGVLVLIMRYSIPWYRRVQQKLDRVALIVRENLSGVRVIRAFARGDAEQRRFDGANRDLADTAIKVGSIAALMNPATSVIMNVAILAVLWFGGLRIQTGEMTQGQIIAFINYILQILMALIVVANLVVTFTKAAAAATRVNQVLEISPSLDDRDQPAAAGAADAPVIAFEDVSFAYDGTGEDALKNISFTVTRGQIMGIIGGTGSGKSTLIQLIPRFYEVNRGKVLVNGVDVKSYPQAQLRRKIGLVPQQAVLFTGTVAENIRWGSPDASDQAVEEALAIAQADFVTQLPEGLVTRIERGGVNLSGGQKQRLTIARALVRQPEILILDDSASALDYRTDAALRQALRRHTGGMTVLIVSQRVSAVRDADQILVLDDGVVVGCGIHEALLETCPVYRDICRSQFNREEE